MKRSTAAGPNLNAMNGVARLATKLGLLLLVLTAISLITTPFTQHFWTWDRYLHGGQDFETNTLLILTALNLVLVLAEGCKRSVGKRLTLWRCFSILLTPRKSIATIAKRIKAEMEHRVSIPGLPSYQLPLLI